MERVQGVPWRVPKITRYDVTQPPQMLIDVGFSERYVWIDLLCIPQEMSDDEQAKICMSELPRQLEIFRNASTAVIWLNDITNWDNTEKIISWFGLKILAEFPKGLIKYQLRDGFDIENAVNAAAALASNPCDLVIVTGIEGEDENNVRKRPAAWFTSLWTLQETMIRPDMILLDKDWRPLLAGGKLTIILDNLRWLIWGTPSLGNNPEGAEMLLKLFGDQGLAAISSNNRLEPLIWGRHRVSTSLKAPAIMSAIGAPNWFRGRTLQQFQSAEEAKDLVLGCYPLDFVEVRSLSGASFFSCSHRAATVVMDDLSEDGIAPGYPLQGTMLPFMPVPEGINVSIHEPADFDDVVDHPSVQGWRVNLDGSTFLPTVAIVASNSIKLQKPCQLTCYIAGNDPIRTSSRYLACERVLLEEWMHRLRGRPMQFALCYHRQS
ncbi:hypothetical protein BDW74DRAFT_151543 [Aspergillus multicolor]|uniref:uncharacterized protein n=1 Tax=Aspergillus multicolor TaxID=41759 RepID=UPI003CCCD9B1